MMFTSDYTADEVRLRRLEREKDEILARLRAVEGIAARLLDDAGQQRPQNGGGGGSGWVGYTAGSIPAFYGSGGPVKPCTLAKASPTATTPTYIDLGLPNAVAFNLTGKAIPAGRNCAGIYVGPYRVITTANCAGTAPDPAPASAPASMTTNTNAAMTDGSGNPMMTA